MGDVELVIKIPEETYNLIKSDLYNTFPAEIKEVIKNGTLLPKGHGRLIDADAILEEPFGNTYKDIDVAETIIEADTESEENGKERSDISIP